MKYIKKPIPVEAFCPAEHQAPEWFKTHPFKIIQCEDEKTRIVLSTPEGDMACTENDYIIQGVDGELYPCRRDIFLKTYVKFEEDN